MRFGYLQDQIQIQKEHYGLEMNLQNFVWMKMALFTDLHLRPIV